ncbi:MAG: alpha/beta hydrolase [Pseudomonadota bacterium]
MNTITRLLLCLFALCAPSLAAAQATHAAAHVVSTERWVEEWDPATQSWVRVVDAHAEYLLAQTEPQVTGIAATTFETVNGVVTTHTTTFARDAARYQAPVAQPVHAIAVAQYGPFRVLDENRVAMVGSTDVTAPLHFAAMLRDFPELERLEMIEAPGTSHDLANLELGRLIREAGIATHVPAGGSVRSGGVELFLAGATRTMDDNAEFAVHSWRDIYGREPKDFAEDAPENRLYLDYYVEMGMSEGRAREFYAMTNSVPHHSALWLNGDEMRNWVQENRNWKAPQAEPVQVALPEITYERLDTQLSAVQLEALAAL